MRRLISALAAMLLIFSLCIPQDVQASDKVKVSYKGGTKTFSGKQKFIYINGKKMNLKTCPVFKKSGANMGPLSIIFLKSALDVEYKRSGNKIILKNNKKKMVLKDGTTNVILNGKREQSGLGAAPMRDARYAGTKQARWIVPLRSVCSRLGLKYDTSDGHIRITDPDAKKKAARIKAKKAARRKAKKAAAKKFAAKKTAARSDADQPGPVQTSPAQEEETPKEQEEGAGSMSEASGKVVLVMDAGHGGVDSGARGNGFIEKNMTLAIVLSAKQHFDRDSRFKVIYTRTADTYPSLDYRWKLANNNNADLFVCVHINSAYSTSTGTETLFSKPRNGVTAKNGLTSRQLAAAMQRVALNSTGFPNRGLVNRPNLRVLKFTSMPACLIEYGFISNKVEAKLMHANTTRYGRQLYEGIVQYMKMRGRIK